MRTATKHCRQHDVFDQWSMNGGTGTSTHSGRRYAPFLPDGQTLLITAPNTSPATPHIHGFIRTNELLALLPFSRATLYRMVKDGRFVKPVKFSESITAWDRAAVFNWIRQRQGA
jgi:predicted DNA-binding transcriptional regulator AlpA